MGFSRGSRTRILLLILLFSSQIYFTVGFCDTSSNSVEYVILIVLDGIRPSALEAAQTPNMDLLMETGSYTYDASSVTPSNTISAIPAIFTGAPPEIHQFTSWDSSLNAESIIEVLEENGYPSAIIGEGANLGGYSATYCTGFENRVDFDDYYFSVALEWFTEYRPFFTFIYDSVPDSVGHQYGHESVEYREAIEKADYQVGRILTLLREFDVFDNSLIVITTDHGFIDTSHDRQCFSIWRGPGIKRGYEIDGESKYIPTYGWVSHEIVDIAPTILEYLGLRPLSDATGEVISAIFEPVSEPRTPTQLNHPLQEPYVTTFFYPWYGESMHWGDFKTNSPDSWSSNYLPDLEPDVFDPSSELYDSKDVSTINWQLGLMKMASIRVSVSSWGGIDDYTDEAFDIIMNEVMPNPGCSYRDLKWCIYYEPEGYGDPSVDEICDDVTYIAEKYGESPHYFKIDGKIVVFVWADGVDGVDYAERWNEVRSRLGNVYTVLKVFGGYTDYSYFSDSWHQYAPAIRYEEQGSYSAFVSPGFWLVDESPRLRRNISEFDQALGTLSASDCSFYMVQTWNEWHEGTQVEPGQPIDPTSVPFQPSDESYGTDYVDAIGQHMLPFMPEPVQIEYISPAESSVISGSVTTFEVRVLDAYTDLLQSYLSVNGEPPQEMTFSGVDAEGYQHFELSKAITEGEHDVVVFTRDEYDYFSDNRHLTFTSHIVNETSEKPITNETDVVIIVTDPIEELNLKMDNMSADIIHLVMLLRTAYVDIEELNSKIDSMETTLETYSNDVNEQIESLENKISRLQTTIVYACIATAIIAILGAFLLIKRMN